FFRLIDYELTICELTNPFKPHPITVPIGPQWHTRIPAVTVIVAHSRCLSFVPSSLAASGLLATILHPGASHGSRRLAKGCTSHRVNKLLGKPKRRSSARTPKRKRGSGIVRNSTWSWSAGAAAPLFRLTPLDPDFAGHLGSPDALPIEQK